jgi:hypothetical protein
MAKAKQIRSDLHYTNRTSHYLGPYLECIFDNWVKGTKPQEIDKCEKCERRLWQLRTTYDSNGLVDEFCKHCGGKIVRIKEDGPEMTMPRLEVDDICRKHKLGQLFFGEEIHEEEDIVAHYIPLGNRTFSIDRYSMEKNWTPEDVQEEIDKAQKKYAKAIETLKKRFGAKKVILHWGLISCWEDY